MNGLHWLHLSTVGGQCHLLCDTSLVAVCWYLITISEVERGGKQRFDDESLSVRFAVLVPSLVTVRRKPPHSVVPRCIMASLHVLLRPHFLSFTKYCQSEHIRG